MSIRYPSVLITLAALFSMALSATVNAASCVNPLNPADPNYSLVGSICTISGTKFDVVYDIGSTGGYGDARIVASGDRVEFSPDLTATAVGASAFGFALGGTIEFSLIGKDLGGGLGTYSFLQLEMFEEGSYTILGDGQVSHSGDLRTDDADTGASKLQSIVTDKVFPLTSGSGAWSGEASQAFNAVNGFFTPVTTLLVEINNTLFAQTGAGGGFAEIDKSGTSSVLSIGVNAPAAPAVPVPAAVWLFGSGLLAMVGLGRRRTRLG